MRHPNLGIAHRLAIGFAVLLLLLAATLAVVVHFHTRSARAQTRLVEQIAPQAQALEDLESAVINLAVQVRRQLLFPDGSRLAAYHAGRDQLAAALERVGQSPMNANESRLFAAARPAVEQYERQGDQLVEKHRRSGIDVADEIALSEQREAALRSLRELRRIGDRKQAAAFATMNAARTQASAAMFAAALLAIVLFLTLAVLITRALRRPVAELLGVARALQAGDWQPALALGAALPEAPRGELAQLARGFATAAAAVAQRERRLAAEGRVVAATASALAHDHLATATLREVIAHVTAEVGIVYWREPGTDCLRPIARHALEAEPSSLRLGEGLPGQAAADGRLLVSHDIPADTPFRIGIGYDAAPPRSVVAAPITFAGAVHGVLLVAALRPLTDEHAASSSAPPRISASPCRMRNRMPMRSGCSPRCAPVAS